jgi:hypothetical protein
VKNKKVTDVVGVEDTDTVASAVLRMRENDFSQIPVLRSGRIVGSLSEAHVYSRMIDDPKVREQPVRSIMQKPFRYVDIETPGEAARVDDHAREPCRAGARFPCESDVHPHGVRRARGALITASGPRITASRRRGSAAPAAA